MSLSKKNLHNLSPNQALILYYAVSIFTGAALLSLPVAAAGRPCQEALSNASKEPAFFTTDPFGTRLLSC